MVPRGRKMYDHDTRRAVRLAATFGARLGGHELVVAKSFRHCCFLGSSSSSIFLWILLDLLGYSKLSKFTYKSHGASYFYRTPPLDPPLC